MERNGQIEKLKNTDAYLLVRHNKKDRNWQTPTKVIEFVEENYNKSGTIGAFDVFQ